jgi:hypothetical protein
MREHEAEPEPAEDGFEHVYVELDWYDGPRAGLADVNGVPHYFAAVNDDNGDDDEYVIWPATTRAVAMEQRQWQLFVAWNDRYENGDATVCEHPGHGGVSEEYDRLTEALEADRQPPTGSRVVRARWKWPDRDKRYSAEGPDYTVCWIHSGHVADDTTGLETTN